MRGLIHDSLIERKNATIDIFKESGVLPAFAVSCSDGILLLGTANRRGICKVKRLLDRVACAGTGDIEGDFGILYESMSAFAKGKAYIEMSKGDMRVFNDLKKQIARILRSSFRDLYNNTYFECEIIIAKLGFEADDDELVSVDFTGTVQKSKKLISIPSITGLKLDISLSEQLTIRDAFSAITGEVKKMKPDVNLFWEAVVLSRQEALNKNFSNVYQRISESELKQWLNI